MRVLMVTREYPPYTIGGTAIHTRNLTKALRRAGVRVDVISFGKVVRDEIRVEGRDRVIFVRPMSSIISKEDQSLIEDLRVPLDIVRFTGIVSRLSSVIDYDVLHIQEPYVGGMIRSDCKITTIHDTSYGEIRAIVHTGLNWHNLKRLFFYVGLGYMQEYFSYKTSRAIITPSIQVKDELVHIYRLNGKKIFVIPNGVEEPSPDEPGKEDAKRLLGLEDKLVVFTTAQHVARKRIETLIRAARRLEDKWKNKAVILIGGEGPLTDYYRHLARSYGLGSFLRFTGWIEEDKLPLYYRAADVFVITSEYEAGPITLLEAAIRGVPIVSTRIQGYPALMTHGFNALLYDVGDSDELSRLIDVLLGEDDTRLLLGKRAAEFARRFTWDRIARWTLGVYRIAGC